MFNRVWLLATIMMALGASAQASPVTHEVTKGESLSRIARRYCGTAALYPKIAADNKISNADLIYPGQVLTVSCEEMAKVPSSTPVVSKRDQIRVDVIRASNAQTNPQGSIRLAYIPPQFRDEPRLQLPYESPKAKFDPYNMSPKEIEDFIYEVFSQLGHDVAVQALSISAGEAPRKCNVTSPLNWDGSYDQGPFQMNSKHIKDYPMYDFGSCVENILAAFAHYSRYGWTRWTVYNTGAYQKYLPRYRKFKPRGTIQLASVLKETVTAHHPDQVAVPATGSVYSLGLIQMR